ncbi:cation-translocating P-type ATPase [Microvirga arabica]|uniref:cation-translocating P-type ATPase n=1 Tax=Microvirga arabica TaxID=1128671 RepID=UPI00193964D8|nr:cation-translocating P-type ATPase [Microvirga arabica]MBM1169981.1 cation-translocating P-type ATPase [Microvirga arabica]
MTVHARTVPRGHDADAATVAPAGLTGLDEAEAQRRLARHGPNAVAGKRSRGLVDIVRGILREPMFLLLLAAAGLYLVLGDIGEGLFMTAGAVVTIGLVVLQEARSERALAALRELAEPFARVIRGGSERRVPARDLVPGDLVLVGEGERLPADGLLIGGDALTVDESALTGESVPVSKRPAPSGTDGAGDPEPGGDDTPYLFAGTLNVRGQGMVHVVRTGPSTRLGRIGASLAAIEDEPTLLQKTTGALIARLGILALAFCAIVAVAYGVLRDDWIGGALSGITLAIALLPEEFPMVLAIFMALGAFRLARDKVLVRRAAVIETLGAATFLCVDKTGTLTENRMALTTIWRDGRVQELEDGNRLPESMVQTLQVAVSASAIRPVDPMDRAVRAVAERLSGEPGRAGDPLRTYPLRSELLAFVQVWADPGGAVLYAAKGAPEAIFRLCRMGDDERAAMDAVVAGLAGRGLRVLGVASVRDDRDRSAARKDLTFRFEGLIGFADPVRPDVPQAVAEAKRAGITVAMITGDYPATALEIARQAGIDTGAGVLTGREIAELDPDSLHERVRRIRVFARIMPEQKLALVEALKANGEVVAMTGDGVNDAPALEVGHIGIAMGQRGTDVAREAADLVLLDDRFVSIIGGVRLGRRIFTNLRKALIYVTAVHVPIAGLALLPLVMGLPPILYPMHVILLELVIDPVCSLAFEGEPSERHAMERPPRPAREPLFGTSQIVLGFIQGAVVLGAVLGLYVWALNVDIPETQARASAFVALVVGNLVLAFADAAEPGTSFFDRSRFAFWVIGAVAAAIVAVLLYVPPLAAVLRLSPPSPWWLAAALMIAVLAGGWFGLARRLRAASMPRNEQRTPA